MAYKLANFYKFVTLDDLPALAAAHRAEASRLDLIGSILLAPEGINCSLAGTSEALAAYVEFVRRDPRFADVEPKLSDGDRRPFRKLLVKVKRWIIRFADDLDLPPDEIREAPRMAPAELQRLITESPDEVVLVDTRNWYETDYGTFRGAHKLGIRRFTQFRQAFAEAFGDRKDRRYVFFCTGGVRCEKVVPWARREGFVNATQLDGGILKYFEDCGGEGFDGTCFVFDHRWIVDASLDETADASTSLRIQPKPLTYLR